MVTASVWLYPVKRLPCTRLYISIYHLSSHLSPNPLNSPKEILCVGEPLVNKLCCNWFRAGWEAHRLQRSQEENRVVIKGSNDYLNQSDKKMRHLSTFQSKSISSKRVRTHEVPGPRYLQAHGAELRRLDFSRKSFQGCLHKQRNTLRKHPVCQLEMSCTVYSKTE